MLSLSIIYACFYDAVSSFSFYPLSLFHPKKPKEHPGLGAASARRHRTLSRPCKGLERPMCDSVSMAGGGWGGREREVRSGVVRVISCVRDCMARLTGLP